MQQTDDKQPIHIFIGTPAYNCQLHTAYLHSVLDFSRSGLDFHVFTVGNESLITRARNTIITEFWRRTEFSHLLFLDADVALDADGLRKLILGGKDVIGAAVPLKTFTKDKRRLFNMGEILERDAVIARTLWLGTAVLLLSRRAVAALVDDACQKGRTYQYCSGPDDEERECFDVYQVGVVDGVYLSEDFWVCRRLRELGYDIHVDLSVKPRHHGMYEF